MIHSTILNRLDIDELASHTCIRMSCISAIPVPPRTLSRLEIIDDSECFREVGQKLDEVGSSRTIWFVGFGNHDMNSERLQRPNATLQNVDKAGYLLRQVQPRVYLNLHPSLMRIMSVGEDLQDAESQSCKTRQRA